ncbi:MAG TPA: hypothetical protein DHV65_11845 [Ktedonobacter sp.]|nr:hypothetical protein [Ktedonobacter sp.]
MHCLVSASDDVLQAITRKEVSLPPKHHIIQKQLVLKISGIQPKIPLIQSNMYGQGSRIQGMMKAHLP